MAVWDVDPCTVENPHRVLDSPMKLNLSLDIRKGFIPGTPKGTKVYTCSSPLYEMVPSVDSQMQIKTAQVFIEKNSYIVAHAVQTHVVHWSTVFQCGGPQTFLLFENELHF